MSDPNFPSSPDDPQQPPSQAHPAQSAPSQPVNASNVSASNGDAPPRTWSSAPQDDSKTLSIVGMILGIVGVMLAAAWGAGIPFAIAAIVLGYLGRTREPGARGFWLTALITGWVGLVLGIVLLILYIVFFATFVNSIPTYHNQY